MNHTLKLLLFFLFALPLFASVQKNVLLLNSYHENLLWTNNITKGVKEVLKPDQNNIVLYIENMDTKKFYKKDHYGILYKLYEKKYKDIKFDLILVSDNNAFDFIRQHRSRLFGDIQTIFCGVNDFKDEMIKDKTLMTGVAEVLSVKETVGLMLKLTPQIKKLYVVNDYLTSGKAWKKDIKRELEPYSSKLQISYNENLPFEELNKKVKSFGSDTAVLTGVYFADKDGNYINTNMRTKLVTNNTAPVYALLNFDMLCGAIGGKVTGGYYQGYPMAKIAQKVLKGTSVKNIQVNKTGANRYVFNYEALKHYNIDTSLLPENSWVPNKPVTLYTQYKTAFITILAILALLIIIVIVLASNIKKRKTAEKELSQLNDKLEEKVNEKTKEQDTLLSLFDKGDSVLFKWNNDDNWSVAYVSQSVKKLLGYEPEDFYDNKTAYISCIYKEDLEKVTQEVIYASRTKQHYFKHEPYRVVTKQGKLKWILDFTVIIRKNDNITHYLGYIVDITEEKEKEKLIFEQSKLAAMGEMIGNIAHQWRQPLNVISTGATGLKIGKEFGTLTDESFFKSCDAIYDNAQYLSKTIDDFTDFIKGDRKKVEFNLNEDINSFLHLVEGSVKSNHITLVKDVDEDICIYGYPNELIQCFINIFNNAKDALKTVEQNRYLFISSKTEGNKVVIIFKDNAGGIPEDVVPHIFEPYFTTKHKSKGTGLGLSMTYNLIVDGMQGTIEAGNAHYEHGNKKFSGARFKITLPLK